MNADPTFEASAVRLVTARGRWRDTSPEELIARWAEFADACARGYSGEVEDYFNDLTTRDSIELILTSDELRSHPQWSAFAKSVSEIDSRVNRLFRADAFPRFPESEWWVRGVVRRAGSRLAGQLLVQYGVTVEVSDHQGSDQEPLDG